MNRKLVLVLAAAVCAGCRSDGGFDRLDNEHSLEYAVGTVSDRANYNAQRTWYLLRHAPGRFVDSFADSADEMRNTYALYFEAHAWR